MKRYYTRVCNFYYGAKSKNLVEKNKSLPLHGIKEISFDLIEIITRKSKKILFINQIKTNHIEINAQFLISFLNVQATKP